MTNFVGWISDLARTHTRALAAVAVREGLSRIEAVDAVQEAFLTLLSLRQARELSYDDDGAFRLMAVIVRNAARNMRRRRHRAAPHDSLDTAAVLPDGSPSVETLLAAAEAHVALLGCVQQLAEVQQRVLTLRILEELTPDATATILGLRANHVAVLLHRAKDALIECLERGNEVPDTKGCRPEPLSS
ncbi:MAG TPA: sigma-70 family RNA polymerase sigma factor [Polyangiaceae bacterium]